MVGCIKTILHVKENRLVGAFAILLMIGLSVSSIWYATQSHASVMLIIVCAASLFWVFGGCMAARSMYRDQYATLTLENGTLSWEVACKRGGKVDRGRIPLDGVQVLELVFTRSNTEGKGYKDHNFAQAFFVHASGKRHEIPSALSPGVYYMRILKAVREIRPNIILREWFDDSVVQE